MNICIRYSPHADGHPTGRQRPTLPRTPRRPLDWLEPIRAPHPSHRAFLLNAALVGAGIYLCSYLKKKAEHLATREELKDLQTQTAELTRTTKEIEAKISDDVWNRQRQWEFDTTTAQVALICSRELTNALREIAFQMRKTYHNTMKDHEEYLKYTPGYMKTTEAIHAMIRKELGIDPPR